MACGQTQLVSAVLNAETHEVLYGELPDWMLTPEEAKARTKRKMQAKEKAWAERKFRDEEEKQADLIWWFKTTYLMMKVNPSQENIDRHSKAMRACLKNGLTDVNFHFAQKACDVALPQVAKLYNRGLYGANEIKRIAKEI